MSERYSIVFSGEVVEGCSEKEVQEALSEAFCLPLQRVERLFAGKPVVVKRGLDIETAEKYLKLFCDAGAVCTLRFEDSEYDAAQNLKEDPSAREHGTGTEFAPPPSPLEASALVAVPSGFWRRFFAFLIDGLVLAIPGWLLGVVFYDQLVRMGQAGRLIGFTIALCYFAILNSSIGHGQTVGKRLQKIRVVDLQGETIPLKRSILRYLLLWLPFFCNGLNVGSGSLWLAIPLALILFGLGGGIVYLFVFNRRDRRSLHDLWARTMVVATAPPGKPHLRPVWRGHFAILAVILVGITVTAATMIPRLLQQQPIAEMLTLQQSLAEEADVHAVALQTGLNPFGENATQWLSVNVVLADPDLDLEEAAQKYARLVLTRYPQADAKDLLLVNVTLGFDIGISSGWKNQRFAHSPSEWRELLDLRSI